MLKKQIFIFAVLLGLTSAFVLPALADNATSSRNSSAATIEKIVCVGKVTNTREQAIIAAMTTYTSAVNSAYSTRASQLQQAYTATTTVAVKIAVKKSWSSYTSAVKTARKNWVKARNTAWSDYKTAIKACKAPASISDKFNSYLEMVGQ
jgi:uncharacterized protein (DUF342 family)